MKNIYVITGGASGIGLATAKMMPKENSLVIISGRNEEKLINATKEIKECGINVEYYVCDTSNRENVEKLAIFAKSKGNVVGVVNSAGVSGTGISSENVLRINALGTKYINQEFFKVMDGGCICDVASCSAYTLPKILIPEKFYYYALRDESLFLEKMIKRCNLLGKEKASQIAYCLSKNFVIWYVKNSAYKYAKEKNIRVVSVSPGFVHTPMTVKEANEPGTQLCLHYSGFDRGAKPEEIGYLISSVINPQNGYLTGTDILVDGGTTSAGFGIKVVNKPDSRPEIKENW